VLGLAVFSAALAVAACGPQWTTYIDGLFALNGEETIRLAAHQHEAACTCPISP
jgi:hypothetical protein